MKRKVYQNLTSPSYERYVFVDSVNGRFTNVIYIYRATDGNDCWHIRKGQYYSSDLKMAREGHHEMMSKDRKEPGAFTEMLMKVIGKKRELTPSERIVSLAKERDLTYDLIQAKKEELETLKENDDRENAAYLEEDIKMLCKRKDSITKRMKDLLDKT